ncbi:hypothetical protein OIO90_001877 [Microbotryomycetes sp. JL221]|nr:hypothetical protein OIO90_001877 [Microbotryomycetes sp. JL221]
MSTTTTSNKTRWTDTDDSKLRRELTLAQGQLQWHEVAQKAFPNQKHSAQACADRWELISKAKAKYHRGPWLPEEDERLISLVSQFGAEKWTAIAGDMLTRTGKQCRERWHNHLDPTINKTDWTAEEEQMIVELYEKFGSKWAEMAKHLPGRPDNAIKNHFNAALRTRVRGASISSLAGVGVGSVNDKVSIGVEGMSPAMSRSTSTASLATSGSIASPRFAPYSRSTPMSKSRSESVSSMGAFSPLRASGSLDQFASPSTGYSPSPYMSPTTAGMVRSHSMQVGLDMSSPSSSQRGPRRMVGRNLTKELSESSLVYIDELGQAYHASEFGGSVGPASLSASAMLVHGAFANSVQERPTFLRHHHSKSTPVVPTHASLGGKPDVPPLPTTHVNMTPYQQQHQRHEAPLMTADSGYGTSTWDDIGGFPGGLDYESAFAGQIHMTPEQQAVNDIQVVSDMVTSASAPMLHGAGQAMLTSPQQPQRQQQHERQSTVTSPRQGGSIAPSSIYVDQPSMQQSSLDGQSLPFVHPAHLIGTTGVFSNDLAAQFTSDVGSDWSDAGNYYTVPSSIASPSLTTPIEQFAALQVASPTVEQGAFFTDETDSRPELSRRGSMPAYMAQSYPLTSPASPIALGLHKSQSMAAFVEADRASAAVISNPTGQAMNRSNSGVELGSSTRRSRHRNKPSSLSIATTLEAPISLSAALMNQQQQDNTNLEGEPTPRTSSFPVIAHQAPTAASIGHGFNLSSSMKRKPFSQQGLSPGDATTTTTSQPTLFQRVPRSIQANDLASLASITLKGGSDTNTKTTTRGPAASSISLGPTASWTGTKTTTPMTTSTIPAAAHPTSNLMSVDQHGRACLPGIS